MPRANAGPKLRLYGPDARHGAKPKSGFRDYVWYITWTERARRRERATGFSIGESAEAEAALAAFLASRQKPLAPKGRRDPSEVLISDALDLYAREIAPETVDPASISCRIEALIGYWAGKTIDEITADSCEGYCKHRRAQGRAVGTAGRELTDMRSAIRYAAKTGAIAYAPLVSMPAKPEGRKAWLTRQQAAKLVRAARSERRARWHLPLFILIGLYTGARRRAILSLQWAPNPFGGYVDLEAGTVDFNPWRKPGAAHSRAKPRARQKLPPKLLAALRRARGRTRVFVIERHGKPVKKLRRSFQTAVRNAGLADLLGEGVVAHTLRHTAITWALQAGADRYEVAGHFNISMEVLEDTYGHHSDEGSSRVAGLMNKRRQRS